MPIYRVCMIGWNEINAAIEGSSAGRSLDDSFRRLGLVLDRDKILKEFNEYAKATDYYSALLSPLSESEAVSPELKQKGIEMEAKLALARQVMAEELKISDEDLTIVPQVKFHIDMEMFASPDGKTLFVHDEKLAKKALKALPEKTEIEPVLYRGIQRAVQGVWCRL